MKDFELICSDKTKGEQLKQWISARTIKFTDKNSDLTSRSVSAFGVQRRPRQEKTREGEEGEEGDVGSEISFIARPPPPSSQRLRRVAGPCAQTLTGMRGMSDSLSLSLSLSSQFSGRERESGSGTHGSAWALGHGKGATVPGNDRLPTTNAARARAPHRVKRA